MKQTFLLVFIIIAHLTVCYCQVPVDSTLDVSVFEGKVEQLTEELESEIDYSDLQYETFQYRNTPLNINECSENELRSLHLNDIQIAHLKLYIKTYGELAGKYELNLVEGFDSTLITSLQSKISFGIDRELYKITYQNLLKKGRHQILTRYQRVLQKQKGYYNVNDSILSVNPDAVYLGSPDKILIKYGYTFYDRIRFGIIMEKDAGEALFHDYDSIKKGFDFTSLHLYYKGNGFIRRLVVGDYNVQFGQGLTMHSSFGFSKDPSTAIFLKKYQSVRPSTGANENQFLRGAAVSLSPLNDTELTLFYSGKRMDATIRETDTASMDEPIISSLQETGMHRTYTEYRNKHAVGQQVYGGNIKSQYRILKAGITAFTTQFDATLQKHLYPYNQFEFRGNSLTNYGFDFSIFYRSILLYGEISSSTNDGQAMLAGCTFAPDSKWGVTILYRNYARNYQNLFSNAFSQGSKNSNEKGIYIAFNTQLSKKVVFSAFADHYKFDWLRYRVDAPSNGTEYQAQLIYNLSSFTTASIRYRYQVKEINAKNVNTIYIDWPQAEVKQSWRIHLICHPTKTITLKSRIEYLLREPVNQNSKNGFLMYQDIIFNPGNKPWNLNFRYAVFETDSYDERLYAYESDVLYAFSVPAYYFQGSRFYIISKYSLSRRLDFWLRYSRSYYSNRETIGTGLEEIDGNIKSEVKAQFLLKL